MEEIGLKELIGVINKRKWILMGFTIACMLASAVFSYFIVKPSYNAKVTFNVEPVVMESGIDPKSIVIYNGDSKALDTSNRMENKVLGSIIKQVKYPNYDINSMNNIINSQDFKDKVYNLQKLNKNISFQAVCNSDTKQITIIAESQEQRALVNACKTVFDYFSQYMPSDVTEQLKRNNDTIVKGLANEKGNIENYKRALDDFETSIGAADININLPQNEQVEYIELMNNYTLACQAFDSYKLVEKELEIIGQSNINELLNIRLQSQDLVPFKVSPRVMVNVILGAVFGFMFCFIVVFFIEYWPKRSR